MDQQPVRQALQAHSAAPGEIPGRPIAMVVLGGGAGWKIQNDPSTQNSGRWHLTDAECITQQLIQ